MLTIVEYVSSGGFFGRNCSLSQSNLHCRFVQQKRGSSQTVSDTEAFEPRELHFAPPPGTRAKKIETATGFVESGSTLQLPFVARFANVSMLVWLKGSTLTFVPTAAAPEAIRCITLYYIILYYIFLLHFTIIYIYMITSYHIMLYDIVLCYIL